MGKEDPLKNIWVDLWENDEIALDARRKLVPWTVLFEDGIEPTYGVEYDHSREESSEEEGDAFPRFLAQSLSPLSPDSSDSDRNGLNEVSSFVRDRSAGNTPNLLSSLSDRSDGSDDVDLSFGFSGSNSGSRGSGVGGSGEASPSAGSSEEIEASDGEERPVIMMDILRRSERLTELYENGELSPCSNDSDGPL